MDVSLFRLVISALSAICGLCVVGIVLASSLGHEPPPTLGAIASMASGALVGILVNPTGITAASRRTPQPPDTSPGINGVGKQ